MLNSLLAGAEKPGGSTFFPAHDSRLLHALEVEAPHMYLQLPFRAVPNMGLVAPEASDLVEELVYRVGAAGARDVCEELANRRFYRIQQLYYEHCNLMFPPGRGCHGTWTFAHACTAWVFSTLKTHTATHILDAEKPSPTHRASTH